MPPVTAGRAASSSRAATGDASSVTTAVLILLGLCALAVPVALVPVPPVLDYPNHLARMCLLAGAAESGPLSRMYEVDWSLASTNVGIDLIAAAVGPVVGCEPLARMLLGASVVLPPLGAVALHAAVFRGLHWWQAGFAMLAWSATALSGFVNFQVGLGLALLAAALDARLPVAKPATVFAVRLLIGGGIFVVHLFAGLFYGALLAALAFGANPVAWSDRVTLWRRTLRALGAAGVGFGIPLLLFLLLASVMPAERPEAVDVQDWTGYALDRKAIALLTPFLSYRLGVDLLFPVMLWATARFVALRSATRTHSGLLLAAGGLALLAVAMPRHLSGVVAVDWRFPIMATVALVTAVQPVMATTRRALIAAAALAGMSLLRTGWIGGIWLERAADTEAVERVLLSLPAGASLVPVRHFEPPGTTPLGRLVAASFQSDWHYPLLAIPRRQAFVPTLFSMPGIQPIRVRPPYDAWAVPSGSPAPVHLLREGVEGLRVANWQLDRFPRDYAYLEHWRSFDYVLVVNADRPDAIGGDLPPELELVADEGFARLYRIRR